MEFVANLTSVAEEPAAWAVAREAEGWHGVGVADHLGSPHLWVTLAQMAASTTRVRLASAFSNNLFRSPVEFAQASLALQRASGGRFEAGLGAGWQRAEVEASGRTFPAAADRAEMYGEALRIAGDCLRTGGCTFTGRYYTIAIQGLGPQSATPPPLVASVGGPRTTRLATPLVDRIEIQPAGKATRAGSLDIAEMGRASWDDVRRLIEGIRAIAPAIPIGFNATCAVGDSPEVRARAAAFGDGVYGQVSGDPARVAETFFGLRDLGIDRVTVSPMFPGTHEALAPYLFGR